MKIKDLTIGTRLALGLGLILVLVTVLGVISYNQSRRLWQNTDDLYNHPLTVGRTVRDIEINILNIHLIMWDIAFDEKDDESGIRQSAFRIDSVERVIYQQFTVLRSQFLGPQSTLDSLYFSLQGWKTLRDELISIRIVSGRNQSAERLRTVNKMYVDEILMQINSVIKYSNDRAVTFYSSSETEKNLLNTKLLYLFVIIFAASCIVFILLILGIRTPLKGLVVATDRYRKGDYNVRSGYKSSDEFGTLASAFNNMAEAVQTEILSKENAAGMARLMMDENDLKLFTQKLLSAFLSETESNSAAVYILNKNKRKFEHFNSIGFSHERLRDFSAENAEGEFGTLISRKEILLVSDIPDDTIFSFPAIAGDFKPRQIISIPIIDENEVVAVISLASFKEYSVQALRLLKDIQAIISARLIGVMNFQKIKDFSAMLDLQNKELDQRSKELTMQSDELREFNIELEQQKRELDEANKLKSTFLSNMSHELRTPLNSVIALSGVLNRKLSGKVSEEELSYVGIIEKNGKALLTLINDILDLSRIESGKEEITLSGFSVNDLVNEILLSINPIIAEKGITVSNNLPAELPVLISDRDKCNHILQNIISNAVKFTEKGSVNISAEVADKNFRICVSDTGIGIPEDFLPYVFDEFRQADDKASRKFSGTGLGLAIVKKYCNLLEGSIEVLSKEGEGSAFTVVLPVLPDGFQVISSELSSSLEKGIPLHKTPDSGKSDNTRTILLVEDSEPQIIQLTDILEDDGFIIRIARNGREALDSIAYQIPDVMILDLQMPEIDGFEVLKQIRDLEATRSIPVLILTAKHITKSDLSFLKENHIYQLIQKGSVNRNELLAYINNMIKSIGKDPPDNKIPAKKIAKNSQKTSILLIEDNTDNITTVKALLNDKYAIVTANDGITGIEIAIKQPPDLILLDISLPSVDGYKVFDEIRKTKILKGIPVVALTARAMKGDREDLLKYGFDGYIAKPIDSEVFEKSINEYLTNGD